MIIRPEQIQDIPHIHKVHCLAFGQKAEAGLVDTLRKNSCFNSKMSLVAIQNNQVVGHVLFSPLNADKSGRPILAAALAPLAVLPEYQRKEIGTALVHQGLKNLSELGYEVVLVLGDPSFYKRFGFSVELARNILCRYRSDHLMALELK